MPQLKIATSYEEQLQILQDRHVLIDDWDSCAKVLECVNYYRLAAYFLPFKLSDGTYKEGTRFQTVYRIYEFDRKLRGILLAALEEVEIYLRAKFAYYHGHKYGSEGYMDAENYSDKHKAERFHENLEREIKNNGKSAFVIHHQKHYDGHFPIWVAVELFTLGMISRFYSDLKTADQKQLARALYGGVPKNLISWLRCCTDLRNICAHYGRLYYRIFPALPSNVGETEGKINRLWGAVLALRALYPDADKWNHGALMQVTALFEEYNGDISLGHIGFPENWESQLEKC